MASDTTFGPILPAPVRDYFTFDFTNEIGNVPPGATNTSPVIQSALWTIDIEPTSDPTLDLTPLSRLIGTPVFDQYKTSQLVGDMVDQCIYVLTAQVALDDGRILLKSGECVCMTWQEPVLPPVDAFVVKFDYDRFTSAFPQFSGTDSDALERMWITAGLIFRNDATSPEQDLDTRAYLLALLTAHIATLFAGPGGPGMGGYGGSGMVGRINSKSVNGVSVSSEGFPGVTGTQSWYLMTQFGALFWKATAAYRTFHYVPGPVRFPTYFGWPYGRFGGPWLT